MRGLRTPVALLLAVGVLLATAVDVDARAGRGDDAADRSRQRRAGVCDRARAHAAVTLLRHGARVQTRRADGQGGVLFRGLTPGGGYRIRAGARSSGPLTVMTGRDAPPSTKLYGQSITAEPGQGELTAPDPTNYQYLTTRDGTKLAIDVHTPGGPGPWPTLIEYSGYGYATPYGPPESGLGSYLPLLGYAVVDVNMRGTGCSGGAYTYFERLQSLDGYDVVETIAHQPWVLGHKVGMLGISYGGISQLFTAATDPPALEAIAPLSVIDSSPDDAVSGRDPQQRVRADLGEQRVHDALPASPSGGQAWANQRIAAGDQTCLRNQALHGEATNLVAEIHRNAHLVPAVANPLDPITFVHKIKAPAFVVCQFTDEQTGGHCPDLAQQMTGTRRKWFTFTNGAHIDSLDPDTLTRLIDFYDLYVEHIAPPVLSPALRSEIGGILYQTEMGISGIALPSDPVQGLSSYRAALAKFDAEPEVRVLFDNGAGKGPLGDGQAGDPYPAFQAGFTAFPVPGTRARSWYLGWMARCRRGRQHTAGRTGSRGTRPPAGRPISPSRRRPKAGRAVSGPRRPTTDGRTTRRARLPVRDGPAALESRRGRRRGGARLGQGVGAERRPAGDDLRGSPRRLRGVRAERLAARRRTRAERISEHAARAGADVRGTGRPSAARGALHRGDGPALLRGARLPARVAGSPDDLGAGGDQPIWAFGQTRPKRPAKVWIGHSRAMASRLILPVVGGVRVPTGLPPCPGLRGEPCRPYRRYRDTTVSLAR